MRNESVHSRQTDVIRIDVIGACPSQGLHGSVRRRAGATWLGADDHVLAVGFVPNRDNLNTLLQRRHAGAQLGRSLPRKAVADSQRILFQC